MNKLLFLLSSLILFISFTTALPLNTTSSTAFAIQAASAAAGVKGVYMCRNANFDPSAGNSPLSSSSTTSQGKR